MQVYPLVHPSQEVIQIASELAAQLGHTPANGYYPCLFFATSTIAVSAQVHSLVLQGEGEAGGDFERGKFSTLF